MSQTKAQLLSPIGDVAIGGNANSGNESGVKIRPAGFLNVSRSSGSLWNGYTTGNSTQTSRILANGNANFLGDVGIGIASAQAPLHVYGADDILVKVESTDRYSHIDLTDNSSTARITNDGGTGTLRLRADKENAVNNSNIQFEIDGTEKVHITSAGDFQIHVDGSGGTSSQQGILRFYRTNYSTDMLDSRIVFDTSSSSNSNNDGTYAAVIAGNRTTTDDGSSELSFYTCDNTDNYASKRRLLIRQDGKIVLTPGADTGNILQLNGADTTSELLEAGITSGHVQFTSTHASGGSNGCGFIFRTRHTSGGTKEKLRLLSDGVLRQVGASDALGQGGSVAKLTHYTIDGTTPGGVGDVTTLETKSSTSNGSDYRFRIEKRAGSGGGPCYLDLGGNSDGSISLGTNTAGEAASLERFRVTDDGKIGINESDPYYTVTLKYSDSTTALSSGSSGNWGSDGIRIENTNTTVGSMSLIHFRNYDADWHIGGKYVENNSSHFIFSLEGSEKLRLTNSGQLILSSTGTFSAYVEDANLQITDDTNPKLVLNNPGNSTYSFAVGTDNQLSFRNEAQSRTDMVIDYTNGHVGVGTNAPVGQLHVAKSNNDAWVTDLDGSQTGDIILSNNNTTNNNFNAISFLTPGDSTTMYHAARITARYPDHAGSNPSGELIFETKEDAGYLRARMLIDRNGKIGIGDLVPDRQLHVKSGSNSNDGVLRIESASNNIMDLGTDGTGHFLNCVNTDPFRIKFNGVNKYHFGESCELKIADTQPWIRIICNAPTSNTDPRAVLAFENTNNDNDEDMYRINFWEGSASSVTANSNASIRYNGSPSDGGDGAIRFCNENAARLFFVNRLGNGGISGSFSKGSGSFQIDHPLDSKKDTHYLRHSFIEGPQADNIYRGVVTLSNGTATLNLDTVSGMTEGTFVLLNTNVSCFTSNESDWTAVKGSVSGNTLTIIAQDDTSTATVSWMVVAERHDAHVKDSNTDMFDDDGKLIVEPLKYVATSDTTDND